MIGKLRDKFSIKRVVFVADKGIISRTVLKEIKQAGYEYIVAAKIKSFPKKYHEQILDKISFRKINEDLWVAEKQIKEERIIMGYSEAKAERDRAIKS